MERKYIHRKIDNERDRQDLKWGRLPRNLSDAAWLAIMVEEVGEVAKAILQRDYAQMYTEITHVCAVGVAWMEDAENHDSNGLGKAG